MYLTSTYKRRYETILHQAVVTHTNKINLTAFNRSKRIKIKRCLNVNVKYNISKVTENL